MISNSDAEIRLFTSEINLSVTAPAVSTPNSTTSQTSMTLWITAFAAFATYFCMYAFRKPFTAATFEGEELYGFALKSTLVLSQLFGYMLSKFIGVKVISEMPRSRRAITMISLMLFAEATLLGFAFLPRSAGVFMLFLNGLSLGMIFGLVLAYLEGRRHTEALTAGLCASFIVSSGVVKSIGRWLIETHGVSDFAMPAIVGLFFLGPMFFSVWLLQRTPEPNEVDRLLRSSRAVMSSTQRSEFLKAYWPGLGAWLAVYVALTAIRTMRDDFGIEIWTALGVHEQPAVFAQSETVVALVATVLNAFAICITRNLAAISAVTGLMCAGFAMVAGAAWAQWAGIMTAFPFMVACGIGLYIPYVAFHTTIFERLISASNRIGNLGFLMYTADSLGYLGYTGVLVFRMSTPGKADILPIFRSLILLVSAACVLGLLFALVYFHRVLSEEKREASRMAAPEVAG